MSNNNTEGLFRRPRSKYWWMRYYAHDPAKGKRVKVQKSTGETSLRKAKSVRAVALAAVATGKHHTQHVERVMFDDLQRGLLADTMPAGTVLWTSRQVGSKPICWPGLQMGTARPQCTTSWRC